MMNRCNIHANFSRVDQVKKNVRAVAVLLDINYHRKRASSEIIRDLRLSDEEGTTLLSALDEEEYIRPNPHREVKDINYVLAEKGLLLINELKADNPALFERLEVTKSQKLFDFNKSGSLSQTSLAP